MAVYPPVKTASTKGQIKSPVPNSTGLFENLCELFSSFYPELLVLDEPFSGLDPIGIATMTEVLRERAAAGVGVVFSATSWTSSRTSAKTS